MASWGLLPAKECSKLTNSLKFDSVNSGIEADGHVLNWQQIGYSYHLSILVQETNKSCTEFKPTLDYFWVFISWNWCWLKSIVNYWSFTIIKDIKDACLKNNHVYCLNWYFHKKKNLLWTIYCRFIFQSQRLWKWKTFPVY